MRFALAILLAAQLATAENARLPGGVQVNGMEGRITAAGHVALTNGILEFVAVQAGGRDYESLLALDCRPSVLKSALLLLGWPEGATNGAALRLDVEWKAGDKMQRVPVETWLLDRSTGKPPVKLTFFFSGSFFGSDLTGSNQVFHADVEQAHVALWWQPAVLINVHGDRGNPYRNDAQGFEVNSPRVPPAGTPVQLIFRRQE